jgi:hypothetical protein
LPLLQHLHLLLDVDQNLSLFFLLQFHLTHQDAVNQLRTPVKWMSDGKQKTRFETMCCISCLSVLFRVADTLARNTNRNTTWRNAKYKGADNHSKHAKAQWKACFALKQCWLSVGTFSKVRLFLVKTVAIILILNQCWYFLFVLVTNCFSFVYSQVYYYIIHEWLLEFYISSFV